MAPKENISKIGRSVGTVFATGAMLYGVVQIGENRGHHPEPNRPKVQSGQVLTETEIAQLRNYESLMAISSKIEPSSTPTQATTPNPTPKEAAVFKMETSQMPIPEMTSDQKTLIEKYRSELPEIIAKINPTPQQIKDLEIYYPIYRVGQDRFKTPWYLTWIVHEEESTASRNPNAFLENCLQCGAMQRDIRYHPQADVDRANTGLEYFRLLPTREKKWDTTDLIWGASAIREYIDQAGSVLGGLKKYSAVGPAQDRYQKYLLYQSELGY